MLEENVRRGSAICPFDRSFVPRSFISAILLALFAMGCAASTAVTFPKEPPIAPDELSEEQRESWIRHTGPFGAPRRTTQTPEPIDRVVRRGYVLEHRAKEHVALWVAHHLDRRSLDPVPKYRRPKWRVDPLLPQDTCAEDREYKNSGFDRGHLAPSADFGEKDLRDETFFLSNAVPQDPINNRVVWSGIERLVRRWVALRGEAYVITGAILRSDRSIGRVRVPDQLFKIVLAPREEGSDQWEVITFVVDNRAYERTSDYGAFLQSVDAIEQNTGLDFFPLLSAEIEAVVESKPSELWPF